MSYPQVCWGFFWSMQRLPFLQRVFSKPFLSLDHLFSSGLYLLFHFFFASFSHQKFFSNLAIFFKRNFFQSLLVRTFFQKVYLFFRDCPFGFGNYCPNFEPKFCYTTCFHKKIRPKPSRKKQKSDQNWSNLIKFDQNHYFDQIWSGLIRFDQIWSVLISFFSLDFLILF